MNQKNPSESQKKKLKIFNSLTEDEKKLLLRKVSEMDNQSDTRNYDLHTGKTLSQGQIDNIFEKLTKEQEEESKSMDREKAQKLPIKNIDTGLRKQQEVDELMKKLKDILKEDH